jgi:RNA polymerase sigma-70 factor (ECF subfamily)
MKKLTKELTSTQLFELAKQGNDAATTRLLWSHYDRLASYVGPLLPTNLKRQIDPDDLLQDTFTVAWQKIPTLDFPDEIAFYSWLRTILRRKLLDRVRAANRQKRRGETIRGKSAEDCSPSNGLLEMLTAESRTPSSIVAGDEAEFKLRIAIVELTERHRQVLELRFLQGLTVATVAARMNCTPGAVHMLTGRAIDKLRQLMGNESKFFSIK